MTRRLIAVALVWLLMVATWAIFFHGIVDMCLGPLNVTEASCRAAHGLPPLTDRDRFQRDWGPPATLLVAGWLVIGVVGRLSRRHASESGL